jgi:hypothetical protein
LLTRLASLLVCLPLLASAATAQADSTWVLWHHGYAAKQWNRIRALDTRMGVRLRFRRSTGHCSWMIAFLAGVDRSIL